MIFTRPTAATDSQHRRSTVFGRVWTSRRANLPRFSGLRGDHGKILAASRSFAVGGDRHGFQPRLIRGLKQKWPNDTECDEVNCCQGNPIGTLPFSGSSHIKPTFFARCLVNTPARFPARRCVCIMGAAHPTVKPDCQYSPDTHSPDKLFILSSFRYVWNWTMIESRRAFIANLIIGIRRNIRIVSGPNF